jgi:WD40 repeat protein
LGRLAVFEEEVKQSRESVAMSVKNLKSSAFQAHSKTVNNVQWNKDGSLLASASADFSSRVWAIKAGGLVCKETFFVFFFSLSFFFNFSPFHSHSRADGTQEECDAGVLGPH